MAEELFAVTITSLADQSAATLVRRFLTVVFKNRSEDSIAAALEKLPLLLTTDVSCEAADMLQKHLEARGATVVVEPWNRVGGPDPATWGGVAHGGKTSDLFPPQPPRGSVTSWDNEGMTRESPSSFLPPPHASSSNASAPIRHLPVGPSPRDLSPSAAPGRRPLSASSTAREPSPSETSYSHRPRSKERVFRR